MSHYAKIENNIVVRVIKANKSFINKMEGQWVRTSFNMFAGIHKRGLEALRKNYAGVGYTYDSQRDAFIPPKLYDSWSLNENSCLWEAPVEYPIDGNEYIWNEEGLEWLIMQK